MNERQCKECGGEMQLESYEPVVRPIEWFMRCRDCAVMTPPAATKEEALEIWRSYNAGSTLGRLLCEGMEARRSADHGKPAVDEETSK